MKRVVLTLAALAAMAIANVSSVAAQPNGAETVHSNGTIPNVDICGVKVTEKYNVQWTLTPNRRLAFHFISQGSGTAVDASGRTIQVKTFSKEVDHLVNTVVTSWDTFNVLTDPYNPDGTPNLVPYQGSLQRWVQANSERLQQISAAFHVRIVVQGQGLVHQNHWVYSVNFKGTQVDKLDYRGGCPDLGPTPPTNPKPGNGNNGGGNNGGGNNGGPLIAECTNTIGYWKNKGASTIPSFLPITLGGETITTGARAVDIISRSDEKASDGLVKLRSQMLASILNEKRGAAAPASVQTAILAADSFLATNPVWGSLTATQQQQVNVWMTLFDNYNNGRLGTAHCG